MRKKYICGNWKMNKTPDEALVFAKEINEKNLDDVDILIAAPFVDLDILKKNLNKNIKVAAQNVSEYSDGAYTGEISTTMLKSMGINDVIIGHSERRDIYFEKDYIVNNKVKHATEEGFDVILCVGESLSTRENNEHFEFVKNQILEGLDDVEELEQVTIAYEPIWAIGTGNTCSAEDAEKMCEHIRDILRKTYGDIADKIRILYGGSVKPNNAAEILSKDDIDGVLVGGASLNANDFIKIINYKENL
ncbi:triose-phosphate isomerase [Peptoniphilus sp.]|jgi:triosephosphate isomerase|uniref:triose-phosphate isomerase n=1 Tax=Peptoniphilus sp. TaxID=1971214 RepID=UPI003D8D22B2